MNKLINVIPEERILEEINYILEETINTFVYNEKYRTPILNEFKREIDLTSKLLNYGYTIYIPEKVKSSIREVSMEDLYKERLISEKLNFNNKISDIKQFLILKMGNGIKNNLKNTY